MFKVKVVRYNTLPHYEQSQCRYGLTRQILIRSTMCRMHKTCSFYQGAPRFGPHPVGMLYIVNESDESENLYVTELNLNFLSHRQLYHSL